MKMKTTLFSLCLAIGALAITACSKEDNNDREEEATFQAVQFRMAEEGFGTETELTRASSIPSASALSEVGDCEAETTLESEPAEKPTAATRGVTTPTHYTIRAYLGGVLYREIKGTFTATDFTPDAGSSNSMELHRNRTYDILCFNDQVTPVGDKLEVVLANAATARIGRQQITLGNTDQNIYLSSKHVGVRVRSHIVAKKDIPTALTATLQGSNIPQRVSYNPADGTYTTVATGALATSAITSPASTQAKFTASNYGQTYAYTSTATNYYYVLPTTDSKDLELNFTGGKIFWNTLTGPTSGLTKTSRPLTANASYRIAVKMKPAFIYLMSNGHTGTFRQTRFGGGDQTPIALVINPGQHLAIALRDVSRASVYWCTNIPSGGVWGNYTRMQCNTHAATTQQEAFSTLVASGRDETWNAAFSGGDPRMTPIGVKATNPYFPAFNIAAQYNPGGGYTGPTALQWFLPSVSDWKRWTAWACFDWNVQIVSNGTGWDTMWYKNLIESGLTQVGGGGFRPLGNTMYQTSTEYNDGANTSRYFYMAGPAGNYIMFSDYKYGGQKNLPTVQAIRSFVIY